MPKPLEILNATIHNEDKDKRLLEFDGHIEGKPAKILFDTGATHNFISESYCTKYDIKYNSATSVEIQLATIGTKTVTKNKATVNIEFDKHKDQVTCYVINIGTADIIIGMEWF
jgi:predicted aspartyl protease